MTQTTPSTSLSSSLVQKIGIIAAILFCGISAYYLQPTSDYLALAALFFGLGIIAMGLALWRAPGIPNRFAHLNLLPSQQGQAQADVAIAGKPVAWLWVGMGFALLLFLTEDNSIFFGQWLFNTPIERAVPRSGFNFHVQMALLLGGISCMMAGFAGGWRLKTRFDALRRYWPHMRVMLLIGLLAWVLRLVNLEYEIYDFVDEVHLVTAVNDLNMEPHIAILTPFDNTAAFAWVWPYGEKLFVDLFGTNFTGLRFQSTIWGTLTVMALYVLARLLFDKPTAIIAAVLLATFPPHMHFSRIGMLLIASPLIGLIALILLVRGLQTQRHNDIALAGATLGLLAYFDEGGELLFPLLIITWLIWMRFMAYRIHSWRLVRWLVFGFAMTSFPVYLTLIAYQLPFVPRMMSNQGNDGSRIVVLQDSIFVLRGLEGINELLATRLLPPFLHYVHLPDTSNIYYGGQTALILPPLVALFLLGVTHLIWRCGTSGMLLIIWMVGAAVGNGLLASNTWSARYMPVAPALVLTMAIGMRYTWALLQRAWPLHRLIGQRAVQGIAIALILCAAIIQVGYYFGIHTPYFRANIPRWPNFIEPLLRVQHLLADTDVYMFYGDLFVDAHQRELYEFWGIDSSRFHTMPIQTVSLRFLAKLPPEREYLFFLDQRDMYSRYLLNEVWQLPDPQFGNTATTPRHKQYVMFHVQPQDRREYVQPNYAAR